MSANRHVEHGSNRKTGFHIVWGFRREAFRYSETQPNGANLHPLATELRSWLKRQGQFSVFAVEHREEVDGYTNPYTYHASSIITILAAAINDSHDIATSLSEQDAMDVEVSRVRNYNEQVLYVARAIEALTKQLLYCTQIPHEYYERASMEALLSTECRGCQSSKSKRHKLSLVGSLAHRYQLCLPFEGCLFEHMKLVARRRNSEAAHSETPLLDIRTAAESRA